MNENENTANRYNEGKIRHSLSPLRGIEEIGKISTFGAEKYDDDNWKKGLGWRSVIDSAKRHIAAFELGEDYDPESGLHHMGHAAWNCAALVDYEIIAPQFDDRWIMPTRKIALDVDGVLADFSKGFDAKAKEMGIKGTARIPYNWNCHPYGSHKIWDIIKDDYEFWFNLEPLVDPRLPFEPVAYITHRYINVTEDWIRDKGFPYAPVYTLDPKLSKVDALNDCGADVFVDDKFQNYTEINTAQRQGACSAICYLWSQPHNEKYDVGYRRLNDFNKLINN